MVFWMQNEKVLSYIFALSIHLLHLVPTPSLELDHFIHLCLIQAPYTNHHRAITYMLDHGG
jgi:hypothetical protein